MDRRFIGNYHTHTWRCRHAGGTPVEFAAVAVENDLQELGITDHMPYEDDWYGNRMRMHEYPEYLQDIQTARMCFPKLKIYRGLECEFLPYNRGFLEKLREELDYLILGQHFFLDAWDNFYDTYHLESTEQFVLYAQSVRDGLATGLFTCLAHPDLIAVHDFSPDDNYYRAVNIILDAAERYAVPLEINANGIRRGRDWVFHYRNGEKDHRDYLYPDSRFFRMAAERQLPCIINADAHSPREMCGKHIDDAFAFADTFGLKVLDRLPIC